MGAPPNKTGLETAPETVTAAAAAATAVRRVIRAHRNLDRVRLQEIQQQIVDCEACPRLREHCRHIAEVKRRAYREETYWGRPVPSFGDPKARLVIIGLAPGAHGANRTGRVFTGDRSGDFLYQALYNAGFANQPTSVHKDDGLQLRDAWITCPVHCAPPDNKPTPEEIRTCQPYLEQELKLLKRARVIVALGRIAFDTYLTITGARKAAYAFGHGAFFPGKPALLCSYHPSQQNTQTGRLTQEMLTAVFLRGRRELESE
jgi:uracil-DNA glycosylase family 4